MLNREHFELMRRMYYGFTVRDDVTCDLIREIQEFNFELIAINNMNVIVTKYAFGVILTYEGRRFLNEYLSTYSTKRSVNSEYKAVKKTSREYK